MPGPLLRFLEGDEVTVNVTNKLDEATAIHWHGLLVPFQMDGVPGLSFPGIDPGETFTYEFDLRQSGTYWYHSHTGLQEQSGVYGSIVVESRGGVHDRTVFFGLQSILKEALGRPVTHADVDAARDLFAAHLARVTEGARERGRPLSVCVLRVVHGREVTLARQGGWLDRAMPQIGAMVSRLVRVEDTAARLSSETFALALPATDHAAARLTARAR